MEKDIMTTEQRKEIVGDMFAKAIAVIEDKGKAYSGEADTLSNFKRIAEQIGLTKYQVWVVYFMKHILAINNSIHDNPNYPTEKTESMYGRITDAINYLTILQCMLEEDINEDYGFKWRIIKEGEDSSQKLNMLIEEGESLIRDMKEKIDEM